MSNNLSSEMKPDSPMIYQIRIKGHLGPEWTDWFENLVVTALDDGETLLTGPVVDQAALHGLLKKVRDLGMPLLTVLNAKPDQTEASNIHEMANNHSEKECSMKTYRKTAIIVGIFYIIGTVMGIISLSLTQTLLDERASLITIAAQINQIRLGALCLFTMGLVLAMIPVLMFPILKKRNEVFALGYVIFRGGLETFTYIVGVIILLLLVPFNQIFVQVGVADATTVQAFGTVLQRAVEISATTTEIVFPLGALMFYAVLYQANLLPRWISVWGFLGAILYEVAGIFHLIAFIDQSSAILPILFLPLAVQEMVMAVWLIVKGFNPSTLASTLA